MESFITKEIRDQAMARCKEMLLNQEAEARIVVGEQTGLYLQRDKTGLTFTMDSFQLDGVTFYLGTKT